MSRRNKLLMRAIRRRDRRLRPKPRKPKAYYFNGKDVRFFVNGRDAGAADGDAFSFAVYRSNPKHDDRVDALKYVYEASFETVIKDGEAF